MSSLANTVGTLVAGGGTGDNQVMGFTIRALLSPLVSGLVWVLVVLVARVARAEPELKLEQVVAVAVRQSPELARARIDLEAARAQLLRAEGVEDTHVGAEASALAYQIPGDSDGRTATQRGDLRALTRRNLPTGGSVGLTAGATYVQGTALDQNGNRIPATHLTSLRLDVTQPLLRGGGATAYEAPIREAAHQRDAAALGREARARDHVVALVQAYWQVAFASRQLEVRTGSLELAQLQLQRTLEAIRTEKVAKSEALAVQQVIAVRKQDVLAGEQELYERSVALRQLAGLEIGPDAIAVKTQPLPLGIDPRALELQALVRSAFEHSAELAALEASRHAAETGVVAADDAASAKLDLDIAAEAVGTASSFPRSTYLSSNPGYTITASLTFDRAIGRRAERGGQGAARATLSTAKVAERDARARLALRATRAVQRANAAAASVALGEEAIDLAEKNVAAEQARFQLGKTTNFEVLRRQDELQQARLRRAASISDYLIACADLDGLSGAILGQFGIVMQ